MSVLWEYMAQFSVILYIAALVYITLFCLMQLHLLYAYRKFHRNKQSGISWAGPVTEPEVTIQLPVYNERYVVERLIDCICAMDYPRDKMEIQLLDDSDDETIKLIARKVEKCRAAGFRIEHVRRLKRKGFKAGALRDGMKVARGEFIAIFDADFLPDPHFLRRTLPSFSDPEVGVVQTRWEHINENYSLITRLQAFQLNVHFRVEQTGRQASDYLLQFNGTAGIWRRAAIEDAGGWEADTLTEDLDLSYRVQLKGWKIKYLEEIGSPAELPAEMNSLKSQQYRWMKGGAETARKLLPSVWRAPLPLGKKIHATGHLLSSTIFLFVFAAGVFSVPALIAIKTLSLSTSFFQIFLISLLSIAAVYYVANFQVPYGIRASLPRRILKFVFLFPLFLALSMGLSLHNSIAILQGYSGKRSAFIRTPKFNINSLQDHFSHNKYLPRKLTASTVGEGLLALYFLLAAIYGIATGSTFFLIYHLLLAFGFGAICYYSIVHLRMGRD